MRNWHGEVSAIYHQPDLKVGFHILLTSYKSVWNVGLLCTTQDVLNQKLHSSVTLKKTLGILGH